MNLTAEPAVTAPSFDTCRELIRLYLRATNENRAHLLAGAFDEHAKVAFDTHTQGVRVPPLLEGLPSIAETLVQRVGSSYGNIYTLCLDYPAPSAIQPPSTAPTPLSCAWLLAMTAKTDGTARLGWGRYRWCFDRAGPEAPWRVSHLTVDIDQMKTLPRPLGQDLIHWASAQPYPFCASETLLASLPPSLSDPALRAFLGGTARTV